MLVVILITGPLQGTLGVQPTGPRPTGSGKLGMAGPLYWWAAPPCQDQDQHGNRPFCHLELQSTITTRSITTSILCRPLSPLLSCNPGRKFWKLRSSNTTLPRYQQSGGVWGGLSRRAQSLCYYLVGKAIFACIIPKATKRLQHAWSKTKNQLKRLFYSCFIILG